jgi:hypothetical protein
MRRLLVFVWILGSLALKACAPATPESFDPQNVDFPGAGSSALPVLFSDGSELLLSWVTTPNDSLAQLFYSRLDTTGQWSSPSLITEGSNWFVNWADFPALVSNKGNLMAHTLEKSSSATFSYDVKLHALPTGVTNWSKGLPLHTDGTLTEHGFVSEVAYSDSSFFISWLDGRETGGGGHDHTGHSGAMSIRAAEVSFDGRVLWDELLDAKTCDCCQTSSAISNLGPVVIYRNRSDREIRDIAITRLVDGKWTEPTIIHPDGWEIAGCPVNGPKVAASGSTLLVGWFTAPKEVPQVKFAFSTDSGASFGEPLTVEGSGVIGRVDVALFDERSGLVSWMETQQDTTYLFAAGFGIEGKMGAPRKIAVMDPGRKSGFPQLELHGDRVYFAWTEITGETKQVRTAYLPKEAFLLNN